MTVFSAPNYCDSTGNKVGSQVPTDHCTWLTLFALTPARQHTSACKTTASSHITNLSRYRTRAYGRWRTRPDSREWACRGGYDTIYHALRGLYHTRIAHDMFESALPAACPFVELRSQVSPGGGISRRRYHVLFSMQHIERSHAQYDTAQAV